MAPAAGSAFFSSTRRRTSRNVATGSWSPIGSGTSRPVATLPTSAFSVHSSGRAEVHRDERHELADLRHALGAVPAADRPRHDREDHVDHRAAEGHGGCGARPRTAGPSRRAGAPGRTTPLRFSGEWLSKRNTSVSERRAASACGTRDGCIDGVGEHLRPRLARARRRARPGRGSPRRAARRAARTPPTRPFCGPGIAASGSPSARAPSRSWRRRWRCRRRRRRRRGGA